MLDTGKILNDVLQKHHDSDKWVGAPFEGIKRLSNTKVGRVGQDFIEELCNVLGIPFEFPENPKGVRKNQSPWDIKVGDMTFELKTATEDTRGYFQFNHIRYHREYDALLCLGIAPARIMFHAWTKADVTTNKAGTLVSMEKGANATHKLTKKPDSLLDISGFEDHILSLVTDPR